MSPSRSIAFFVHALRSDWNNGNAHFLRGLARALGQAQLLPDGAASPAHQVTVFEPAENWSTDNLLLEPSGAASLAQFSSTYPDLDVRTYSANRAALCHALAEAEIVIVHEWNTPETIDLLLSLRDELGFKALFHDTHHRASSNPAQLHALQVGRFDGVLAFGEALRTIYRRDFGLRRVWTLHEAADTTIFYPREAPRAQDVVWIGNWGDEERSREIRDFLVYPAAELAQHRFTIYGVRYPQEGLQALASADIHYGGYLPNLEAPAVYAASRLTVHIPRQQYAAAMTGIPTIRVFEALASGIPLISAPWHDTEQLFGPHDLFFARSGSEMRDILELLLSDPTAGQETAERGLGTVRARHTCGHRAVELTAICEEVLA